MMLFLFILACIGWLAAGYFLMRSLKLAKVMCDSWNTTQTKLQEFDDVLNKLHNERFTLDQERDRVWCKAMAGTLNADQIASLSSRFNDIRPDRKELMEFIRRTDEERKKT